MSEQKSKYAPVPGKIPGTAINLGGHELVLAPLSLIQVEHFESVIGALGQKSTLKENLDEAIPLIHASLSRNYPDMSPDEARGLIDVGNFREALEAIVTISGYRRAAPGEKSPASP